MTNKFQNPNIKGQKSKNIFNFLFVFLIFDFLFLILAFVPQGTNAQGTSLYLSPGSGSFFVGSTFSVSIVLDTKGNKVNAVELDLKFPPEILQVTTPTAGESFISEWIVPPSYSNIGGTISFKGGIPEGIVTSAGLVSTITFRARVPGIARVEFLDSSKVLLADGKGTVVFTTNFGGEYQILVPPPEGSEIISPSHPDPDIWASDSSPTFSWEKEIGVTDFSYTFSQNPNEIPDTVSEGDYTSISYDDVPDGIWYFHLRTKKDDIWGKTSHFPVKIDTTPAQKFEPKLELPAGFVYFEAKDILSGISHYELSITDLNQIPSPTPFFIEAHSPFKIPSLSPGKYRLIIRALDKAGNEQDSEITFQLISPTISFISGKGFQIKGIILPWQTIYLFLFLFFGFLVYLIFYFLRQRGYRKGIKEIKEALAEIEKIAAREKEAKTLREKFKKDALAEIEKIEEKENEN